jgi:hypothetical protein
MPFDKAAQMIDELLGVQTNEETVRQLTERMGACMEAAQGAESDAASSQEAKDPPAPQQCALSADGAMVSLVKKQWAETRTVAIGEPQEKRNADGEIEIHVRQLSYFSRLADASTFSSLAEVEIRRRSLQRRLKLFLLLLRRLGLPQHGPVPLVLPLDAQATAHRCG